MKKNIFIVLLVLLFVVFVIWFFWFRNGTEQNVNSDEAVSEELTQEDVQVEIEKCEKEKAYFQAECFQKLAVKTKDPLLCKRVEDVNDVGYESSSYHIDQGVCLSNVAKELDYDVSVCEQVKDLADQYESCVGHTTVQHVRKVKDAQLCEKLDHSGNWYGNCLASSVKTEADVGVCKKAAAGSSRVICNDQAYQVLAVDNKDISFCDKGKQMSSSRGNCISNYANYYDQLDLCHTIGSDQDMCICYNMYFSEVNEKVCSDLSDATQKTNCQKCLELDLFKNL